MNPERKRTILLVTILILVGAAVAIDRGLLGGSSSAVSTDSKQRYALVQAQLAMQQELLGEEDDLRDALDRASRAWEELKPRLVTAPTPEVAPAALRERVNEELRLRGVQAVRVLGEEVRQSGGGDEIQSSQRVVPIRIRISFDAPDSDALYRAIAALDGTDRFHARVAELSIRGGGVNTQAGALTATLSVDTAVLLGGGS